MKDFCSKLLFVWVEGFDVSMLLPGSTFGGALGLDLNPPPMTELFFTVPLCVPLIIAGWDEELKADAELLNEIQY